MKEPHENKLNRTPLKLMSLLHFEQGTTGNWKRKFYDINASTVEPRYLELGYFELPLISKWKFGPCYNMKTMTTGNKMIWKRGEIAPKEQFLLFSTLFYIYISNFRSQITYSFVKCDCSIYCFPHSLNSDMSKYGYPRSGFSESLGIRDNESRLY